MAQCSDEEGRSLKTDTYNQQQNYYLAAGKSMTDYLLLTCNIEHRIGEVFILLFSQSKTLARPVDIHKKMKPQPWFPPVLVHHW